MVAGASWLIFRGGKRSYTSSSPPQKKIDGSWWTWVGFVSESELEPRKKKIKKQGYKYIRVYKRYKNEKSYKYDIYGRKTKP